jgi:hypothetical protein
MYNAKHNGLVKLAAFLSVFSKKMKALQSPIDALGYMLSYPKKQALASSLTMARNSSKYCTLGAGW